MPEMKFDEIDHAALEKELASLDPLAEKKDKAVATIRNKLKGIIETKGYNKKAFDMLRVVRRMDQEQRRDFLRSFKPMFELMMAETWAAELTDLVDQMQTEPADGSDGKVTPIKGSTARETANA